MVSSSPEVFSSSSDLKADDPKARVETMDLVPTADRSSSGMPSLSETSAHNTPPPYEEPSRNDNANDSYPGSGDISSSYVTNDRRPLIFQSNPANNSSSGQNMGRRCNFSPLHLAILVLGIISAVLAVSRLPNVASQPAAHARMRDEWDNEVHAHEALRGDWAREREEILSLRVELERDRENWEREHVAQAQRHQEEEVEWEREIQAHADLRADWVRAGSDIPSLRAELQHQKAEWERERLAQAERRQKEEVEWDKEIKAHEALRADWARQRDDVEALRADLQREKAEWKRQRAAEKRCKEDELARVRAGFQWEDLTPNQRCLRHNARGYTARLAKVPRSYDPVQACKETAIEVPGVKIKGRPLKCEDRGCSGVFGHWIAESGESICATYFKNFDDKGCTSPGSRRRRFRSRLENLQFVDDWRKMCSTTPATFRHQHFPKPDTCDIGIFGASGVWEIKDEKC
ncbi:hypothetical protein DFH08DRAFT_383019 [Mycena albidolilacea]|uniref:Uncharacterized protein n=1 Tax=Mycena albidolilacea TaxID=1033008 RepID=A0AAD7EHE5_9AGAR|nr:hypothetical protein DFH08DRAFT_383019 [Mycena albidolilacea]